MESKGEEKSKMGKDQTQHFGATTWIIWCHGMEGNTEFQPKTKELGASAWLESKEIGVVA